MKYYAPPFPNDDAFFCRFFTEIGSYKDEAGRRLHEVDFRAEEHPKAFKKCPFHDSRKDFMMNFDALKQITSEWSEIKQGVGFYTSLYEKDNTAELDLARAWRICLSTMFAPSYLFKRGNNPYENGSLPTPVSGVFKIMLDVPTTIDLMLIQGAGMGIAQSVGVDTATKVRSFADEQLILLNGDYVCAGSPALIDDVNGILFQNQKIEDYEGTSWDEYFPDKKEFAEFTYKMSSQYVSGLMFLLSTAISMEVAYKKLDEKGDCPVFISPENENRLSAYERRRRFALNNIIETDQQEKVFTELVQLVDNSEDWNIESRPNSGINTSFDISMNFLKKIHSLSPVEILDHHNDYTKNITSLLEQSQKNIDFTIGSKDMFLKPIQFGNLVSKHPQKILEAHLR